MERPSQQRRAQRAASTHEAIIDAAGRLFADKGYFATTVHDIAELADVSPATVYAVAGGKQGMITSLAARWAASPILHDSLQRLPTLTDPFEVVSYVARASREVREQHGDTMRILLATASSHPPIACELKTSTERYRGTMDEVARHLEQLGVPGGRHLIGDVLWFFFGYSGYFTLLDDNGWDYDRAQEWLLAQCTQSLGIARAQRSALSTREASSGT
ncbi:TetR/AcrR family transcriptional regulator [Streptomyces sp. SYP-A7185]|uniref:TetR/AcrR family transcriptional regulator n=1 Tax=Streptomyces sp. SYP-A7185 TaxID=3040076 RepID=UPI0038F648C1